jgi:hypothetical protein
MFLLLLERQNYKLGIEYGVGVYSYLCGPMQYRVYNVVNSTAFLIETILLLIMLMLEPCCFGIFMREFHHALQRKRSPHAIFG